uniref:Cysteine--tRNA ligase n=1 Tax=Lygus hesperus TaxID=30085 RepID=A0A0A9X126_LYGHE
MPTSKINEIFIKIRTFDTSTIVLPSNNIRTLIDQGKSFYKELYDSIRGSLSSGKGTKAAANPELTSILDIPTHDDYNPPLPPLEHLRVPLYLRATLGDKDDITPTYPAAYIYERLLELIQIVSPESNIDLQEYRILR